jgi:hypothetical protein
VVGVTGAPHAPWILTGESMVGLARAPAARSPLPDGLGRLPGPLLVVAVSYSGSPVGPYLELAIGEPARLGGRPGFCITTMVVDSAESRAGGRANWGFPKELGSLVWEHDGRVRRLRWVERDITIEGRATGTALPVLVPVRSLQRRSDGPAVVPGRLRGLCHVGRIHVEVPDDDPLAALTGAHPGGVVSGMRFAVRPARRPVGLASSLRAPLRAPEPAMSVPSR